MPGEEALAQVARDWFEEVRALGAAAAWQARSDYDPARGVPFDAFVHQRVMSRALLSGVA